MNTLYPDSAIDVRSLHRRLAAGDPGRLVDVRTPGEYGTAHVPGAESMPLDTLDVAAFQRLRTDASIPVYMLCQSGGRAAKAIRKLENAGVQGCVLVTGGTQAWEDAGLPLVRGEKQVLPLMRQVQLLVGAISATGAALAILQNPLFAIIPLVTGTGLFVAGLTGWCGMALLLAKMPWNGRGEGR